MNSDSAPQGRPRVLVIMPAWNEEEAIGATIADLRAKAPWVDLVVINDGSTDSTAQVARRAGAFVIDLPYNMGVGAAMRTGYRYARRMDYDIAMQMDSDGQHPPEFIETLIEGLGRADIVIGSRFAASDTYKVRGPRKWAMGLLSFLFTRISGEKFTDVTSGFRAVNRRGIQQYCEFFPAEYLGDTIDSTVMAIRSGCKVIQVPVEMRERQGGTPSSGPLKSAIYLVRSFFAFGISMTRKKTAGEG
ncbi:MAG: glycosyltransferase family 2 protein [Rothia sp. (in: high G+C Gram-positive bacteria)]|uniref:glycosyltransferase family 2 protein n=1 Tax=Rothia sp. (in: high G+C Gram-positive bacteria) TaxID=1885016 RepID=UPI00270A1FD9|nr:glycosyltransferase family 2 protein [Rothia sp. (in: high G+C Gram-positive bacteria)]